MKSLNKTGKSEKTNQPLKLDMRTGLTYTGLLVLFVLITIASGFWQALAISLFFGALYLVYRTVRYKGTRRISAIWAMVLFVACGIVMPPVEPEKQEAHTTDQQVKSRATPGAKLTEVASPKEGTFYQVTGIVDGDTIKIKIGDKTEKVRVIGIDTPETQNKKQCYGKEASSKMQSLAQGKKVRLEADTSQSDRDQYGRLLRFVFLEDSTDVGKTLISEGYAHEYTYNKPYKYVNEYKLVESDAKTRLLGFWATTTCSGNTSQTSEQAVQVIQAKRKAEEEAVRAEQVRQAAAAEATRQQQLVQQQAAEQAARVAQAQQQTDASNVYYKNCTAARAAGAAPVYRGQPGYASHLDRDDDGIGCE